MSDRRAIRYLAGVRISQRSVVALSSPVRGIGGL
jgi:hypothetical protein